MKLLCICLTVLCIFSPCFAQHSVAFRLTEKELIPEGIAYNPTTRTFFISSIFKNKIIEVSKFGVKDFITSQQDGFMGGVGLHVDTTRQLLWACSGNIMDKVFQAGIFVYDLKKKKLLKKVTFPLDTVQRFFNDIIVAPNGEVFITDTFGHAVWRWNMRDSLPQKLLLDGEIPYPNGIEISPNAEVLFIATDNGLMRITIGNGHVATLSIPQNSSISSRGLDGIVFYGQSIIGIQNGTRNKSDMKIVRYFLTPKLDSINRIELIDKGHPLFDIPTTAVLNKNELYVIANSQIDKLDQKVLKIPYPTKLQNTTILKYKLLK